ncbi:MAG: DUF115 domain-containing protein [Treponema sp.]|jgi:hypothetical protein|nr:DUF115 domain-containing protein [Treponema sp.]
MDRKFLFERNLLSLSKSSPELCVRLSAAKTDGNLYRFLVSRTGETIAALVLPSGSARPLHSTVDPQREAERLTGASGEEGFFVFLGLGGGFAPLAALEKNEQTKQVLVVEYGCDGVAELLCSKDYSGLFGDSRFHLLVDPPGGAIQAYITGHYRPALHGGIRAIPLLPRTEGLKAFALAHGEIKQAVDACGRDYSVQAWFGKRWFSNILRNLSPAEQSCFSLPPVRRAAIAAAGPSLDRQLPRIRKERAEVFLVATDTSLPALLNAGLEPDAALSIDCQHIGYRHFFQGLPEKTFLFLDLASPPVVAARSAKTIFFAGGHPLAQYIRRTWRPLPNLDTSGANVTYTAFSLAENLGASEITLYGADFSYPEGRTYARGTYIYPFFEKLQNRFFSMEAQHSAFLYRDPFLEKHSGENGVWRYETESLRFYKSMLERKTAAKNRREQDGTLVFSLAGERKISLLAAGSPRQSASEFLASYKQKIESLSSFDGNDDEERNIITTLLPAAAALRRQTPLAADLFRETRDWCAAELEKLIGRLYL